MDQVGLHGGAVDQYIIKKYGHTFAKKGLQHRVHKVLEGSGGVGEPKGMARNS